MTMCSLNGGPHDMLDLEIQRPPEVITVGTSTYRMGRDDHGQPVVSLGKLQYRWNAPESRPSDRAVKAHSTEGFGPPPTTRLSGRQPRR